MSDGIGDFAIGISTIGDPPPQGIVSNSGARADVAHYFGGDLWLSPTGDLAVASGPDGTTQRVLRRLLTAPGDYLWQLGYGGGLPSMVGQVASASSIRGVTLDQMRQEAGVGQAPAPTVQVKVTVTGVVFAEIAYADADGGGTQVLTVPIS